MRKNVPNGCNRSYKVRGHAMVVVRKKYAADRLEMKRHWDIAGDGRGAKGKEEGRPELARAQSMNQLGKKNPLESGEASKLPHCEPLAIDRCYSVYQAVSQHPPC